ARQNHHGAGRSGTGSDCGQRRFFCSLDWRSWACVWTTARHCDERRNRGDEDGQSWDQCRFSSCEPIPFACRAARCRRFIARVEDGHSGGEGRISRTACSHCVGGSDCEPDPGLATTGDVMTTEVDDVELLVAIGGRDAVALRTLFERHAPWLTARLAR